MTPELKIAKHILDQLYTKTVQLRERAEADAWPVGSVLDAFDKALREAFRDLNDSMKLHRGVERRVRGMMRDAALYDQPAYFAADPIVCGECQTPLEIDGGCNTCDPHRRFEPDPIA